jgi:hypothetical protein
MADKGSGRKEKDAAILNEDALDGIAGGAGEGREAGLNIGDVTSVEDIAKRIKMIEDLKKLQDNINNKL